MTWDVFSGWNYSVNLKIRILFFLLKIWGKKQRRRVISFPLESSGLKLKTPFFCLFANFQPFVIDNKKSKPSVARCKDRPHNSLNQKVLVSLFFCCWLVGIPVTWLIYVYKKKMTDVLMAYNLVWPKRFPLARLNQPSSFSPTDSPPPPPPKKRTFFHFVN